MKLALINLLDLAARFCFGTTHFCDRCHTTRPDWKPAAPPKRHGLMDGTRRVLRFHVSLETRVCNVEDERERRVSVYEEAPGFRLGPCNVADDVAVII